MFSNKDIFKLPCWNLGGVGAQGEKRKKKNPKTKTKTTKKSQTTKPQSLEVQCLKKIEMDPSQSFIVKSLDVFARHFFSLVFLYRSEIPSLGYGSGYSN